MKLYEIIFFSWTFVIIVLLSLGLLGIKEQVKLSVINGYSLSNSHSLSVTEENFLSMGMYESQDTGNYTGDSEFSNQTLQTDTFIFRKKRILIFSFIVWTVGIAVILLFKKIRLENFRS
jgi:hypothetical protein